MAKNIAKKTVQEKAEEKAAKAKEKAEKAEKESGAKEVAGTIKKTEQPEGESAGKVSETDVKDKGLAPVSVNPKGKIVKESDPRYGQALDKNLAPNNSFRVVEVFGGYRVYGPLGNWISKVFPESGRAYQIAAGHQDHWQGARKFEQQAQAGLIGLIIPKQQ